MAGEEEARLFSGGFSRWLQDGFSQLFSREDGWERRRGEEGGNVGGDVGEERRKRKN